jgi:hypothetical protein
MANNILLQVANEVATQASGMDALLKVTGKFGYRFLINFVSVFILIRLVYYPIYKSRELFFTYFIFNTIIFLICFLLNKVELSMGAAFGLFAVFSMLRYRTEDISQKDMTYLFLCISMGLIAAVTKIKDASDEYEYLFLGLLNFVLILVTYLIDGKLFLKSEIIKTIYYDNIELIKADKQEELKADIELRTGIKAHKIFVQKIDFLRDMATLKVYFYE